MATKKGQKREATVRFWHGPTEYVLIVNSGSMPSKILLSPSGTLLQIKYWDHRGSYPYPVHYPIPNPHRGLTLDEIAEKEGAAIATIAKNS